MRTPVGSGSAGILKALSERVVRVAVAFR